MRPSASRRRRSARSSWMGVPIRLEVIHLGEHELVFGLAAGHLQVGVHQLEPVGLPAAPRRVLRPHAGIGALGVPPHRVVVEVADHEHRPARLAHREGEQHNLAGDVRPSGPPPAGGRVVDGHRHFDDLGTGIGDRGSGQTLAVDSDRRRLSAPVVGDADQLQRRVRRPDEQLGRLCGDHPHPRTLRLAGLM